jgi:omega-6 fatty acid desaturase (delta-12 desaturase)
MVASTNPAQPGSVRRALERRQADAPSRPDPSEERSDCMALLPLGEALAVLSPVAPGVATPLPGGHEDERRAVMAQVAPFQTPQPARSALAAGLVVRVFIIQHDCGHASLFRSRWLNDWLGRACSLITLTPYSSWRRQHSLHHAVWNNLDARMPGTDIYSSCLTLAEYKALPPFQRLTRRVALHPVVALVLLPPVIFLLAYRLPLEMPRAWRRERRSVWLTNASLAAAVAGAMWCFGVVPVLLVHLPVVVLASIAGVWLFSIQHRFEDARWLHREAWDPMTAATEGCSYLKLPRVLQWFTGSIGYHHIHHLAPRVPNYRLQDCHESVPGLAGRARTVTLWQALRAFRCTLWDEQSGRMVDFPG